MSNYLFILLLLLHVDQRSSGSGERSYGSLNMDVSEIGVIVKVDAV